MGFLRNLRLGRLSREDGGSMLTEFAFVVPGFFVLMLGGLTIGDALSAYNRVQNISTTVGIMTSRLKAISNEDMVGISSAARGYLFPFPATGLSILVAAVWVDDAGTPTIQWCERWNRATGQGGTCSGNPVVGSTKFGFWETGANIDINDLDMPAGILNPNTGLMVVEASYAWNAPYWPVSPAQMNNFKMTDTFFYSPRADVTLTPPTRDRGSLDPTDSYNVRP